MKTRAAILAAVGLCASSAQAFTFSGTIVAGAKHQVGQYSTVHPDCTSEGYATVRVTNPPQHGTVSMRKGKGFAAFPAGDPRSVCNTRKVDGVIVDYQPQPGFIGTDYFSLDAISAAGAERMDDYQITVK
jgi:hypothetical protein